MTDQLDMGLDEIAAINRKSAPRRLNRRRVTRRGRPFGRVGRPMRTRRMRMITSEIPSAKAGKWDMNNGATVSDNSSKLTVTSLHYNVSEKDLLDLFTSVGPVRKVVLHYDRSGRSLGTADVWMMRTENAIESVKQFNGKKLDGQVISIKRSAGATEGRRNILDRLTPAEPKFNTRNINRTRGLRGRGGRLRRGRGRRGFRGGLAKSSEQLDIEMAEYMKQGSSGVNDGYVRMMA